MPKEQQQFEFPACYSFPPFFVLQPNPDTRAQQSTLWGDLILNWCRSTKTYQLDLNSETPLFRNDAIGRRLSPEAASVFVDDLVAQRSAEWIKRGETCSVLWNTIDRWASLVYQWAVSTGQTNTVLTVWEIQNGDNSKGQEFEGLDTRVLLKALALLESQGKAQVFSGTSEDNLGVKIFTV